MTNLSLTYSFWWIFICLVLGGAYAWVQYTKKSPWSSQLNYGLAGLRWLLVSFLCFLLLEPYFNSITNYFQKPVFIIALDNSTSIISSGSDLKPEELIVELDQLKNQLGDQGFDVSVIGLEGEEITTMDSIKFNQNSTDLSKQLNGIKNDYMRFNVGGLVLVSDGIFNMGYSPLVIDVKYPVYTIGVGDTSEIQDLAISKVNHNATVFEGNSLMLEIHSVKTGFQETGTRLKIRRKGKLIAEEKVVFDQNQFLVKTVISVPIKGNGKQSLDIELVAVNGEFMVLNNNKTIYFDVIDAQKKILIIAASPHPDIKAIKSSIEKNEYYDVTLSYEIPKELDFDLIIAHQYPSKKSSSADREKFRKSTTPKWLIIGGANNVGFLKSTMGFNISSGANGFDLVRPLLNLNFDNFRMSDGFSPWLSDVPPLGVPYGIEFNDPLAQVILNQQIGNVATEKPLLFFTKNNDTQTGVLMGVNSWKWKLDEFRKSQSHQYFDELISKTIQYLSSDKRKKRFYVATQKTIIEKGEDILFETQEYNALFEQITGSKVNLEIKSEKGEKKTFTYVPLSLNSVYKVQGLPEGVYSFKATTILEDKSFFSKGQFIIKSLDLELLNPTADFDLLKKLAVKSNGKFYPFSQISNFNNKIKGLNPVSTIHSTEKDEPFINLEWVLVLILLFGSVEWFLRKYFGGY